MVDASDEDLPVEWVKKQRKDGSFYYCNTMTGVVQDDSPNERGAAATSAPAATRPRRGIARMFKVRMGDRVGRSLKTALQAQCRTAALSC